MTAPTVQARLRSPTVARIAAPLIALALLAPGPIAAEPAAQTRRFQFELWAQNHCPTDTVVWVRARSPLYSSSEERWYGRTTDGAIVCKLEAQQAGYRARPLS